jgi:hypothetical protein
MGSVGTTLTEAESYHDAIRTIERNAIADRGTEILPINIPRPICPDLPGRLTRKSATARSTSKRGAVKTANMKYGAKTQVPSSTASMFARVAAKVTAL